MFKDIIRLRSKFSQLHTLQDGFKNISGLVCNLYVDKCRPLSTVNATTAQKSQANWLASEENKKFTSFFPDIVRDLTVDVEYLDIPEVTKRLTKVLEYNVPIGKKTRGLTTVASYKIIEDPQNLNDENIRLANVLGWCIELIHSSLLIKDDIMDSSETRRGSPCWYLVDGVGMQAINDTLLLEYGAYMLLKKYFYNHHCYVHVLELLHDMILKTCSGQTTDLLCIKDGVPQLDSFTMDKYTSIVKYKTSYYSFQLPIILAMYLAGRYDPEVLRQTTTILLEMGHYFQVQDDFLDCFGDPAIMGKKGTDIQGGKCTWLVVLALQRASPDQKIILEQNYGKPGAENVAAVRSLYEELGLPNTYAVYEEESYNLIKTHIQQTSQGVSYKLLNKCIEKMKKTC